jgi:hypothetical protein
MPKTYGIELSERLPILRGLISQAPRSLSSWARGHKSPRILPSGTIPTFRDLTTEAARMLSGFVPSGFERFFRDFGRTATPGDVEPLPVQEAEAQRLKPNASRYGMGLFS